METVVARTSVLIVDKATLTGTSSAAYENFEVRDGNSPVQSMKSRLAFGERSGVSTDVSITGSTFYHITARGAVFDS